MLETIKYLIRRVGKSFIWTILTIIFGLLQIIYISTNAFLLGKPLSTNEIITGCGLLFFSSALISAVCIDYFYTTGWEFNKNKTALFIVLIPILILIFSTMIYISVINTPYLTSASKTRILNVQLTILSASSIYSLVMKFFQFR
ncbi:hypothetical protein DLM76_20805 [Leptospira yasudae]|nr:hypothetical protein DLM76_20805 [Leptospira yasudae]